MSKRLKQKDIDKMRREIIKLIYEKYRISFADIGRVFKISRQRVEQIIKERRRNEK
jgi:DNA-binding Lrp family transcriptional regulator